MHPPLQQPPLKGLIPYKTGGPLVVNTGVAGFYGLCPCRG
jgi:hypothetical protein